jgi:membrane-associated protease RseP (regulator of RpoE activity)
MTPGLFSTMKTILCLLALAGAGVAAEVPLQSFDLPNGTRIVVENGKVRVETNAPAAGANASASSSVNMRSDGVNKVATVTTERNGRRETRTVVIGPDGKATVGEAAADKPAGDEPAPAPDDAWLGVHCAALPPALRAQLDLAEGEGVLVEKVADGSPAAKAGLGVNDLILALNQQPVGSVAALRAALLQSQPGAQIAVDYLRKGRRGSVSATLARRGAPEPSGIGATLEKLRREQPATNTKSRTVIVGGDGKSRIVEGDRDDAFDAVMNDPTVPESFKETVRQQREQMRKFMEEHSGPARGSRGQ